MATTWAASPEGERHPSQRVLEAKRRMAAAREEQPFNVGGQKSILDGFGNRERTGAGMRQAPGSSPAAPGLSPHHLPPLPVQQPHPQHQQQQRHHQRHVPGEGASRALRTLDTLEVEAALRDVRYTREQMLGEASLTLPDSTPQSTPHFPAAAGGGAGHAVHGGLGPSAAMPRRNHHHDHQLSVIGGQQISPDRQSSRTRHVPVPAETPSAALAPRLAAPAALSEVASVAPSSVLQQPMFQESCYCCGQRLRGRGEVALYETARVLDGLIEPLQRAAARPPHETPPPAKSKKRRSVALDGDRNLDAKPRWHM